MKDEWDIFSLNSCGKFDLEKGTSIIECHNKESRSCGYRRSLRIELLEVFFCPLVDSFRINSILVF
jgi:hypothetical protein